MYFLKENKLVVIDSYLYLKYDIEVTENVNLLIQNNQYQLQKSNIVFLKGNFYLNGYKLEEPFMYKISEETLKDTKEVLSILSNRIKELDLDLSKITKELENVSVKSTKLDKINKFITSINKYLDSNPDKKLLLSYLNNEVVNTKVQDILFNLVDSITLRKGMK